MASDCLDSGTRSLERNLQATSPSPGKQAGREGYGRVAARRSLSGERAKSGQAGVAKRVSPGKTGSSLLGLLGSPLRSPSASDRIEEKVTEKSIMQRTGAVLSQ